MQCARMLKDKQKCSKQKCETKNPMSDSWKTAAVYNKNIERLNLQ